MSRHVCDMEGWQGRRQKIEVVRVGERQRKGEEAAVSVVLGNCILPTGWQQSGQAAIDKGLV